MLFSSTDFNRILILMNFICHYVLPAKSLRPVQALHTTPSLCSLTLSKYIRQLRKPLFLFSAKSQQRLYSSINAGNDDNENVDEDNLHKQNQKEERKKLTTTALKQIRKIESYSTRMVRIERIISNRGVASRKDVKKLFRKGLVKVDGKVIKSNAQLFPKGVTVEVAGKIYEDLIDYFIKPLISEKAYNINILIRVYS